jgi:hypothetical protein
MDPFGVSYRATLRQAQGELGERRIPAYWPGNVGRAPQRASPVGSALEVYPSTEPLLKGAGRVPSVDWRVATFELDACMIGVKSRIGREVPASQTLSAPIHLTSQRLPRRRGSLFAEGTMITKEKEDVLHEHR